MLYILLDSYFWFVWVVIRCCIVFFFCKQKTAYEMRISDWSSDVCSSDLLAASRALAAYARDGRTIHVRKPSSRDTDWNDELTAWLRRKAEIGRASCRERVCQYV